MFWRKPIVFVIPLLLLLSSTNETKNEEKKRWTNFLEEITRTEKKIRSESILLCKLCNILIIPTLVILEKR